MRHTNRRIGTLFILAFVFAGILNTSAMAAEAGPLVKLVDLLSATYDRAPALILGLLVLLALPPLALIGVAIRRPSQAEASESTRLYRRQGRGRLKEAGSAENLGPLWPSDAWLELQGGERRDFEGSIVRIGRDADNDICLDDKTVHRYHAAIRRTDEAAYVVTDLSSAGGNGVLVNGERILEEALLSDGDKIELGQSSITFVARPA